MQRMECSTADVEVGLQAHTQTSWCKILVANLHGVEKFARSENLGGNHFVDLLNHEQHESIYPLKFSLAQDYHVTSS